MTLFHGDGVILMTSQDAASELQRVIDGYVKFANSSDDAYGHIESSVRLRQAVLIDRSREVSVA